ncbi:hypothetical protein BDR03DRAFT_1011856 [Suillus americanus]|nr:hypothetical protein BDR03DRAFT_1011856 [Suillus americanus]
MPTGLMPVKIDTWQPQFIDSFQFSNWNMSIDSQNMPQNVFHETHAELANFLCQNPRNFQFTTSIKNNALTLSFQPTPFSSLLDTPNLEPPTPCSPSYSPVLWEELSYTNNLGTDPEHPVHRSDPDPSSVSVVRSTDPL